MGWFGKRKAEIQIAWMLLTRLPAGNLKGQAPALAEASWAFPIGGLPAGLVLAGSYLGLVSVGLSSVLAAFIALGMGLFVTGAIHEDGLADCADGFGGGQTVPRKLEIMRDSQIGSYGMLGLILIIGMRIAALSAFEAVIQSLFLIVALAISSRLVMVFYLVFLPAARTDGLGQNAGAQSGRMAAIYASLLASPALIYLGFSAPLGLAGLILVAVIFAAIASRQIGGQTGDVCGGGQILSETAAWILLTILL